MRPRQSEIDAVQVTHSAELAAMDADHWRWCVDTCLERGTHAGLVSLYAQSKLYPSLRATLSAAEMEAAAYEAPEDGDLESDFDTY